MNNYPTYEDIFSELKDAIKNAVADLFTHHGTENFYHIALMTTGEALPPFLTASSQEGLEVTINKYQEKYSNNDYKLLKYELTWSYADSLYAIYKYEEYFKTVEYLFYKRPNLHELNDDEREIEFDFRLKLMEEVMLELDKEGLFGTKEKRKKLLINIEIFSDDDENIKRAIRLNPSNSVILEKYINW